MIEKYYISKKDNTDLNIYRCGFEECSKGHYWGPGVRDHYIIHLILSGNGSYTLNDQTYILEAGKGFLIPPGQIVRYQADVSNPWTYSWVGFHGLKAKTILIKSGITTQNPVFDFNTSDPIVKILNDMIGAARNDQASDLTLTGYLYLFLAELLNNHRGKYRIPADTSTSERYVTETIEFIRKNYASHLSVTQMAKRLKIDRSYLSALFSRYLGISPREFIINFRMDRAIELLKNPRLSVSDVARSVGYDDPLQFSKTFKKTCGRPPTHFRKDGGL